jgi:hypothetical protein
MIEVFRRAAMFWAMMRATRRPQQAGLTMRTARLGIPPADPRQARQQAPARAYDHADTPCVHRVPA